ncbi:CPBP family intramembrane metalloprotease [Lactobacillus sp. ESL0785]|uniref:CPBP family intramembrane glutamic endopeptidase n=1 Tax=Lactobacillus sp. ESL0785 TaxID=2983232 RepID=UPI0023FA34E0|nr:CPBP family intramembrane glutamic endopeptidase [Lactobacillus sp. ESL0785]WEV70844.1 CPBP family intramembrane metalloprotease [Lactobacillus sp. ESL0785]
MKKIFYYMSCAASIILAFAAYQFLQCFYFFPKQVQKLLHLNQTGLVLVTSGVTFLVLGFIFYLYKRQLDEENTWGFNQKPHWDYRRLLIMIVGVILILLVNFIMVIILGITSTKTSANQASLNKISLQAGVFYAPMVCLIAPICEETIFRGLFFNTFFIQKTQLNKWVGIICSGFLFAYMHDPKVTKYILLYWALGCVLAWVYMTTKDLRYSIMTHALYNSMPYLLGAACILIK